MSCLFFLLYFFFIFFSEHLQAACVDLLTRPAALIPIVYLFHGLRVLRIPVFDDVLVTKKQKQDFKS